MATSPCLRINSCKLELPVSITSSGLPGEWRDVAAFSRSILQTLLWRKSICWNTSKQALRLGEFAGLFRSFAVISYPHFSAVYVLVFSQWQIWQAAMQLLCLFFYYYYFAFIAPWSLNVLFHWTNEEGWKLDKTNH